MKMHPIDLSLLPDVTHGHAWFRLDDDVANRLATLRRVSERLKNSIKFMCFSGADEKTLGCDAKEAGALREGFLRAALAELVSVEEMLPIDLTDLGRTDAVVKLNDTKLPHLHFCRELRSHELHLYHNKMTGFSSDVLWGNIDKPEDATSLMASMWTLDGVTVQSFGRLRNSKHYSADEIRAMVTWFHQTQAKWGVHEILLRVAIDYAKALADQYFPLAP